MIKSFRVQNYKALRDVAIELTPIHVLIGPNDSGKTSLLEQSTLHLTQTHMYAELAQLLDLPVLESRCPAGFAPFSRRVRSILAP